MNQSVARLWSKPVRMTPKKMKYEFPLQDQLMGVEIELERLHNPGAQLPPESYYNPDWVSVSDGSLRNGREYVLSSPMSGYDLSSAIHRLLSWDGFKRHPYGSTHIHMDMTEDDVTLPVLQTMIALVFLFEDAIFKLADPQREWCGFTNRLTTAPERMLSAVFDPSVVDSSSEAFDRLFAFTRDGERYYGLNLNALNKYGSIEFRYFPTAENAGELLSWISLVQSFKKAALALGDVKAVERVIEDDASLTEFVATYFGEWQSTILANVSSKKARRMYEKALAHAPLAKAARPAARRFNSTAITGRTQLTKFARKPERKREEVKYKVLIGDSSNGDAAPLWEHDEPTFLFFDANVYYAHRTGWNTINRRRMDPELNPTSCRMFAESIPYCDSLGEQLRAAITSAEMSDARRDLRLDQVDMICELVNTCGNAYPGVTPTTFEDVE